MWQKVGITQGISTSDGRNTESLVRKIINILTYHTGLSYSSELIYDPLILYKAFFTHLRHTRKVYPNSIQP